MQEFVIIGNQNAITNKDFFPLIRDNKIWLGYGFKGGAAHFYSPYEDVATAGNHKKDMIFVMKKLKELLMIKSLIIKIYI